MLGARLVIDGVDGIDDVDDILHGDGLVGAEHDASVGDSRFNALGDKGLEAFYVRRRLAHLEVVVLVDIDGHILFCHGLAPALGQQELHGIGADERGGNHEEDEEEEDKVGHGGGGGLDFYLVLCFYHNGKVCCVGDVS